MARDEYTLPQTAVTEGEAAEMQRLGSSSHRAQLVARERLRRLLQEGHAAAAREAEERSAYPATREDARARMDSRADFASRPLSDTSKRADVTYHEGNVERDPLEKLLLATEAPAENARAIMAQLAWLLGRR